ncbi:helix-turn-helix transcriptional regulator [Microbacterium esteraromaticum]|uniref:Helix-turn-helix transcriptional regulator n=1 Tax=Microbacterium esteraromaticum TaxID=57043 RepID=A0A7D7WCA1_9MICO|nr:helix-turn-helix domain-containing protein [Microbacterium esteraromaticum]QMU96857.1 helix-turn-helix transcriptional regulator [Microbacterium esteraromaticum]
MPDDTKSSGHQGVTTMTSAMLKALANPLRRRIVNELIRRRHARAADLAADLDVAANTLSFHLRVLADAGLIEPDPEHARDRRDRVWKPAELHALELGSPDHPIEDTAAGAAFVRLVMDEHADLLRRVASWTPEYTQGRDPVVRGTFQQRHARLTRAEFEKAMTRVDEVFREIEEAHDEADPASLFWQIDILAADETI